MYICGHQRPHHRVLKPPGGESHDIFGAHANQAQEMPHRNTNHLQSSVFGDNVAAAGMTPNRKYGHQGGGGASTIVFGAGEDNMEPRKIKDYQRSNIFGDKNEPNNLTGSTGIRRYNTSGDGQDPSYLTGTSGIRRYNASGDGIEPSYLTGNSGIRRYNAANGLAAGNPITGEGYVNGSPDTNTIGEQNENGQQNGSGVRIRNPPGGHSTRLW